MSRSYTQTVVPVSRVPERFFGWTAWILLLLLTAAVLIFSLTTARSDAFTQNTADYIANVIVELDGMGPDEATETSGSSLTIRETFELFTTFTGLPSYQEALQDQDAAIQDFGIGIINWVLDFFNQLWVAAIVLFFPLFVGIFGLLTVRNRVVSGLLLTVTAIMTSPLILLLLIGGIIPLFFIIAAILLFVRKNKIITHEESEITTVEGEQKEKRRSRRERKKEEARLAAEEAKGGSGSADADASEEPTKRRRRMMEKPAVTPTDDKDTIVDQSELDDRDDYDYGDDDDVVVAPSRRSRRGGAVADDLFLDDDVAETRAPGRAGVRDLDDVDDDDDYDYEDSLGKERARDNDYDDDEFGATRQFDAREFEEEPDVDQTRQFRKIEEDAADDDVPVYDESKDRPRRRRRREDE